MRDADGAAKTLRPLAATENTLLELIDQGWDGLEEMDWFLPELEQARRPACDVPLKKRLWWKSIASIEKYYETENNKNNAVRLNLF